MRAHLLQTDIAWHDRAANFDRVRSLLAGTRIDPGDLILLPEMFDTGFSMETGVTADRAGDTLAFITDTARRLRATVQAGRTAARPGQPSPSNVMTIADASGTVVCEYAKVHSFTLGGEHEHFTPGAGVTTWAWGELTVCPAICYDLRFPELFRDGLARGAEVFAIGACWPESRQAHWRALLIARAIENQAFVLGANRTGRDPKLAYTGGTIAVGPRGDILGELGSDEGVLSVDVDPRDLRRWRSVFPAWKEAR